MENIEPIGENPRKINNSGFFKKHPRLTAVISMMASLTGYVSMKVPHDYETGNNSFSSRIVRPFIYYSSQKNLFDWEVHSECMGVTREMFDREIYPYLDPKYKKLSDFFDFLP